MKNPQAHLSDEKAQKELKQFLIAGWVIAVIAFLAFGWAAIASFAFGARCILLSWHKGNTEMPHGKWLKAVSVTLVIVSLLELVAMRASS